MNNLTTSTRYYNLPSPHGTVNPYTAASIVQMDDTKGFNSPVCKFEILNNFTGKTDLSSKW